MDIRKDGCAVLFLFKTERTANSSFFALYAIIKDTVYMRKPLTVPCGLLMAGCYVLCVLMVLFIVHVICCFACSIF